MSITYVCFNSNRHTTLRKKCAVATAPEGHAEANWGERPKKDGTENKETEGDDSDTNARHQKKKRKCDQRDTLSATEE